MNHTKKYLVVPYVQNLEKPSESYLENLNKNMTDIIQDKKLPADEKIKFYSKNLNNFLLKYDPDSFGVAPTLTKLAEIVTRFIENNNNPNVVEQDLTNLFENNINSSQSLSSRGSSLASSQNNSPNPARPVNFSANTNFPPLSTPNNQLRESVHSNIPDTYLDEPFNDDLIISSNEDSFGFPKNTRVTENLRSKVVATHPEGLPPQTRFLKLPSNTRLPSPLSPNLNFVNQEPRNRSNKHKNKQNTSKGSNGRNQSGTGCVWKTKRFF